MNGHLLCMKTFWLEHQSRSHKSTKFSVLTVVLLKIHFLQDVMLCHWVCIYQHFDGNMIFKVLGTTHPMTQQGSSLHNFFYLKHCGSAHDFSTSIDLSTHPLKCSRDTDKDDTLYCESLFKFKPFLYSEITGPSVWRYIMYLVLIKYLACSNWHIRCSKSIISSSMKQKADKELEDPTADKW